MRSYAAPIPTALIKPSATNTGVPNGTSLTVINGDLTISAADTIVENRDIRGFVNIQASNVTFRNSVVRGRSSSGNRGLIQVNSGTNIRIENIEINPTNPSVYWDGIWGDNYVATKLNISGVVDGVKMGSNTKIEKSYIHDMSYFSSDPNQGGGETHNDGLQILEGDSITVYANTIVRAGNAAVQVTQDYGPVTNLTIDHNWMDGGGATLNIAHKTRSSLSGVVVKDNLFGRNSSFNAPILISTKTTIINTNNLYEDTRTAVPVQQHD